MKRGALALLAVAGLALTGCAGGQPAASSAAQASTTSAAAAPSSTAPTEVDPMVYQAWAKRERASITKWVDSWEANTCSAANFSLNGEDPLCSATLLSGTYVALTLDTTALGAKGTLTPSSTSYLGQPPAGQTITVNEVTKAIKDATKQAARWDDLECMDSVKNEGCVNVALMFPSAMKKLDTALSSLE
ncbi:hypothetical protein [Galactobacter valiniphilus]|uniref:hypothetical protein n=1 Tax=Galactobacter valiniphilus TaxID=2676122 RepID=UPI0037357ADA